MDFRLQILALVIYALCVMRLVRLINADRILDGWRLKLDDKERTALIERVQAKAANQTVAEAKAEKRRARWNAVNYLVTCPWCVSMWLAVPTAPLLFWWIGLPIGFGVMYGFGVSQVVGMAAPSYTDQVAIEDDDQ